MKTRELGRSGLQVSEIGLGCNNFGWRTGIDDAREILATARDLGISLLDTADMYGNAGGSEEILGELLGQDRRNFIVATKFGYTMGEGLSGASANYVVRACEASLRRLRTDYIDLYQLHLPDSATPVHETLEALHRLVETGKVRHVGVCNLDAGQLQEFIRTADSNGLSPIASLQVEYSLLAQDAARELLPLLASHSVSLLPFFPLAGGMLTGKYRTEIPESSRLASGSPMAQKFLANDNKKKVERLADLAEKNGRTLLDLAFGWLLAQPVVASVIAGATSARQLEQNVIAGSWVADDILVEEATRISR